MSTERRYWVVLFNHATWQTFLQHGSNTVGFRERRWTSVSKIPGDAYLLCYLTGISRFIGALAVIGKPFYGNTPIWTEELLPARLAVKPILMLSPETAIPVTELQDQHKPNDYWAAKLHQSPTRCDTEDGDIVMEALLEAQVNPVVREFDERKLRRSKPGYFAVVPTEDHSAAINISGFREPSSHTEIQWLLLKLGNDLGLDIWVARNDRQRRYAGHLFTELPRLLKQLPRQFDSATQNIIELIDVLWLDRGAIVAAFEVESTTTVYSGLLRMADLVAMQPNLNIALYIVAPEQRRQKVLHEVNRPTFRQLALPTRCCYISFTRLRNKLQEVAPAMEYLKPEFIETVAESCTASNSNIP